MNENYYALALETCEETLGRYHLLLGGGAVCLWGGPEFFGLVKGGDPYRNTPKKFDPP